MFLVAIWCYFWLMTFNEFKKSLQEANPPDGINELLKALWYDGRGDWESAHNIAQDIHTNEGSLIHAYLHRKEGDSGNASYWYNRAGRSLPKFSLDKEWENIVKELLGEKL
jgi:hypothetical protein